MREHKRYRYLLNELDINGLISRMNEINNVTQGNQERMTY